MNTYRFSVLLYEESDKNPWNRLPEVSSCEVRAPSEYIARKAVLKNAHNKRLMVMQIKLEQEVGK